MRNTIKTSLKVSSNMKNFFDRAKLLQLLNKFAADIEDKHFENECMMIQKIPLSIKL